MSGSYPSSLSKYRLLARLGSGGMAEVYLAVAGAPGGFTKLHVLKLLRPDVSEDDRAEFVVILPASDGVLEAVKKILDEHPELGKVSVEGHTDNRGSAAYNKKLSGRRAASVVRWLTRHGIDAKRLSSVGYGFDRPLDTNDTEEGRQANRRVEFHLVVVDGKPVESDTGTVKESNPW
jgi:serine/threonine protein kinase